MNIKSFYVGSVLCAFFSPAIAQNTPPPVQKTYDIKLTADQVNVVGKGLLELTGRDMMPTWQAIMGQIQAQNNPPLAPVEPVAPAPEPDKQGK
jgi:hypothetical protein